MGDTRWICRFSRGRESSDFIDCAGRRCAPHRLVSATERPDRRLGCSDRSAARVTMHARHDCIGPDRHDMGSFRQSGPISWGQSLNVRTGDWVWFVISHGPPQPLRPRRAARDDTTINGWNVDGLHCSRMEEPSSIVQPGAMTASMPSGTVGIINLPMIACRLRPSTPSIEGGAVSGRITADFHRPNCQRFLFIDPSTVQRTCAEVEMQMATVFFQDGKSHWKQAKSVPLAFPKLPNHPILPGNSALEGLFQRPLPP